MIKNIVILIFVLAFTSVSAIAQTATPVPVIEQELPANSTVRGRVFYEDTGRAVKRASIMLVSKGSGGRESSGLTDANGLFQIKNVRAGTYYAFVNAPGIVSPLAFADITKPKQDTFDLAIDGFPAIIVNGITDLDVQIPARRGGAISGRVMYSDGDAAIGVKVEILRKVEEKFVPVIPNFSTFFSMMEGRAGVSQTDDRGFYRFAGLPSGEYIVKIVENVSHGDKKGYESFEGLIFGKGSFMTMYYPDVFELEKAESITIGYGQEQSEMNITIPDRELYTIEGKIVSAKDKLPIRNAKIILKKEGEDTPTSIFGPEERLQQSVDSDERGVWHFKELPKGKYKLVVEAMYSEFDAASKVYGGNTSYASNRIYSNLNMTVSNAPTKKFAAKLQEITIEDKSLSELVIELNYGATISGTVVTENNGEMPESVTIRASTENVEIFSSDFVNNFSYDQKPKKNHDFRLESVAEGKTYLRIYMPDQDYYVKSATAGGKDLLVEAFELKEGDALVNVKIVLGINVGTLKGKVLNENNEVVKNAQFTLVPTDARRRNASLYRSVIADTEGNFETKSAPGEFAIVFLTEALAAKKFEELNKWLDEAMKSAQTVRIDDGKTTNVTVKKIK